MRAAGVVKFGVIGFCYGAWLGMHLSKEISGSELVCAVAPHPSAHIEGMMGGSTAELAGRCRCPWGLFPCGRVGEGGDSDMYDEDGAVFKALEERGTGRNFTRRFERMAHGFTLRGAITADDSRSCEVGEAVQECMDMTTQFFVEHGLLDEADRPPKKSNVVSCLVREVLWGLEGCTAPPLRSLDAPYPPSVLLGVSRASSRRVLPRAAQHTGWPVARCDLARLAVGPGQYRWCPLAGAVRDEPPSGYFRVFQRHGATGLRLGHRTDSSHRGR